MKYKQSLALLSHCQRSIHLRTRVRSLLECCYNLGMRASQLKEKYLKFFKNKGHSILPSAPLVPENDPTALFISAGMQPLISYLMGQPHPEGVRLANVQKCVRTDDIDKIGDTFHHTFFEMLGNWSLGDYWKEDSIAFSYEFLTKELRLDHDRLWVTCFAGDEDASRDDESAEIWKKLGISQEKIFFYPKKDNWWGPVGESGPCGPDTEIFYEVTGKPHSSGCKPGDNCGRFFEIWNNVFMQYKKTSDGKFETLEQKNVDTGMGVERTTAVLSGYDDNYKVEDLWGSVLESIEEASKRKYEDSTKAQRIIADHVRAATFIISDGVEPSNKERGYVVRRLIRRSVRYGKVLGINEGFLASIAQAVVGSYKDQYPELEKNKKEILKVLSDEEIRFQQTIERGLREIEKLEAIDAKTAFYLYESYGFPLELTEEIATEKGHKINKQVFEKEFEKHKELSRTASAGMFKGGLAEQSEETTKLHTATHLLHASLRKILGDHVQQKGSNITAERLRFDFSHPQKLTDDEVKKVEDLINEQIKKDLPVKVETKTLDEALKEGALAFFGEKYTERVSVYTIGPSTGHSTLRDEPSGSDSKRSEWFSKEVCGGPHIKRTGEIGRVRIIKQEKIGSGLMRIYAKLV